MKLPKLLLAFLCVVFAGGAAHAQAGRFQFVHGDVRITHANGSSVAAAKGTVVEEGDTLATGPAAQAQLTMKDGGIISMRPDSTLRIEVYRYSDQAEASNQGFFALLKGGFRSITGAIGRANHDNYKVRTATATIGIRGTDHEPMFIPVPAPGETPVGPPGTYDKVNSGGTYLQTAAGRVDLNPNQVGFVPAVGNTSPIRLQNVPDFLKATPSVQSANKTAPQAGKDAAGPDGTAPQDAAPSTAASSPNGGLASTAQPTELARLVVLGTSDPTNPSTGGGPVNTDHDNPNKDLDATPSTTANLLKAMPSAHPTLTFTKVTELIRPTSENGAIGGSVTALTIVLKNLDSVPSLQTYSLRVTDAQERRWTGTLIGTPALATLMQSAASLTTTCLSCPNAYIGTGTVKGSAIGNPKPLGFNSDYRLEVGNASVTGSVFSSKK